MAAAPAERNAVSTPPEPAPIRVPLVDDQPLPRKGFRRVLEAEDDLEVPGEGAEGLEALAEAERPRPDVVLMDIRMPNLDGVAATERLLAPSGAGDADGAEGGTGPKVLILTTFDLDEYVFAALRAGASGFLLKDTPAEDLVDAVRVVAAGEALLAPSVTRRVIEAFAAQEPPAPADAVDLSVLTDREREVLVEVARGRSNAEIAADLFMAEATVKTHVGRLLAKLEQRDRVQLAVFAYDAGLVRPRR